MESSGSYRGFDAILLAVSASTAPPREGESSPVTLWLVPAAVLIVWLIQTILGTWDRFLSWDEAVYFSQVADGKEAASFAAQRSRVISYVAWPVGLITDSVLVLRVYLLALVSAGVIWIGRTARPLGPGPQIGIAVFLLSAAPLFHVAELSPNIWVGVLALAIATLVVFPRTRRLVDLGALAVVALLLVWLRPPDGAVVLTAMAIVMLIRADLRDFVRIAALTIGGLTGLGIWIADALSRFGGVSGAVDDAGNQVTVSFGFRIGELVDRLDGPLRGLNLDGISWWAVLPWLAILGGAVVAVARFRSASGTVDRSPRGQQFAALVLTGGGFLAVQYTVVMVSRSLRYVYPAWLLLSVGVGLLVVSYESKRLRPVVAGALLVLVVSQLAAVRPIANHELETRNQAEVVGLFVREEASGAPCALASEFAAPQVAFASGCSVRMAANIEQSITWLNDRASEGAVAYFVVAGEPTPEQSVVGEFIELAVDDHRIWSLARVRP